MSCPSFTGFSSLWCESLWKHRMTWQEQPRAHVRAGVDACSALREVDANSLLSWSIVEHCGTLEGFKARNAPVAVDLCRLLSWLGCQDHPQGNYAFCWLGVILCTWIWWSSKGSWSNFWSSIIILTGEVHDEKDKDFELEISWICPASNYEVRIAMSLAISCNIWFQLGLWLELVDTVCASTSK